MGMQKNKTRKHTRRGFSAIELLITATILSIVTSLGLMGISRAKASIRLSGAAREYASYIEKARMHSIRSHADNPSQRAGVAINTDKTSYDVTVDLDGDGNMDTRTITLPDGVSFETIETIAFDWRGRTWNTVDGNTTANAQVSIRLKNSVESISIDVTGSGDVTIDSQVFDDSVPNVNLKVGDLASGATPEPTPNAVATPTPDAGATPDPGTDPTATPTPDGGGGISDPTPTPAASPTATPSATPAATPAATPRATPTPTPATCTISTDRSTLELLLEGTGTIKVSHSSTTSLSISATSSKPAELQVTPGGSQTVAAGGSATFTIKSKKSLGTYSITFSSSCGSTTVPVVVAGLSL
jgi:prepilin-type N-terminal cleavage/methylation domain-containing protein